MFGGVVSLDATVKEDKMKYLFLLIAIAIIAGISCNYSVAEDMKLKGMYKLDDDSTIILNDSVAYILIPHSKRVERANGQFTIKNLSVVKINSNEITVKDVAGNLATYKVKDTTNIHINDNVNLLVTAVDGKVSEISILKSTSSLNKK